MALSGVTFNRGEGGLGRPLAGEDHISGLVAYMTDGNLPTGFTTSTRVKLVYSIAEAEALGIAEGSANHSVIWYHIDEFFKMNPKGALYIGLYDSVSISYAVIETVQNFANGKIRQIAVFDETTFTAATLTTLQVSATALAVAHKPLNVLYAGDITGTADLTTLADLRALSNPNVSAVIGEDGSAAGNALAVAEGYSVTCIGAALGALSLANVHENIGWLAKFNLVKGVEFDVPAFANLDLTSSYTDAQLSAIQALGYIFIMKYVGNTGTYFNDSPTATLITSDYAYIENNRTIDKAIRGVYTFMLPNVNGPLTLNSSGQMSEATAAKFRNDGRRAIAQMLIDGEVSAFDVLVDPTQDVLTTSKVVVTIQIVPIGVARQIEVNIGFTVSI